AFEAAHRLHRGLAGGDLAPDVGAAVGVVAELDDGHDVQDAVDSPVPCPGEPVPVLVTGGSVDGGGAVPGGEVCLGREPGDVASTGLADNVTRPQLGQQLACLGRGKGLLLPTGHQVRE